MNRDGLRRTRREIAELAHSGLDWVTFATQTTESLRRAIPFERSCWHPVDPGTLLFTGSLNQNVGCSGTWLAEYEYIVEDVNQWSYLASSGSLAGATSLATRGDLSLCGRYRSAEGTGMGDELRGSFVIDDTYWGAAGFIRDADQPWFTTDEVRFLASLSDQLADGFRRALLVRSAPGEDGSQSDPGVVVFDDGGNVESISPAAERWIGEMVEVPPPLDAGDSKLVRIVAARARAAAGQDPISSTARARARTRSGRWLLLYGTQLSGRSGGRTAVIIQPAANNEIAPLIALAYALSDRECQVTRLCMRGDSTQQISHTLGVSTYTVQDHLKSIFDKTGVRSRAELVGQVFLEHYVPRWEDLPKPPNGWLAKDTRHQVEAEIGG